VATSSPNAVPATEAAPFLALGFPSQTVVVALPQTANLTSQTSFNTLRRLPYTTCSRRAYASLSGMGRLAPHVIRNGTPPEKHVEELAQVFEIDKPYFVSRWRWPERFNP